MKNSIDLHGLTIDRGYNKSLCFIKIAYMNKIPWIKIITGRSGKMNSEFEKWASNPSFKPYIDRIKWCDNYGAWLIKFKSN